jgi:MtrB/PioB family decaheme-associated outer membrane protein
MKCNLLTCAIGIGLAALQFPSNALGDTSLSGDLELGIRFASGDDDSARFGEYRDLDDTGVVSAFDLLGETDLGELRLSGVALGDDDQRLGLSIWSPGRLRGEGFWRELTHLASRHGITPYRESGAHVVLPTGFATRVAAAASPSQQLQRELATAPTTNLGFRWLEAGGRLEGRLGPGLTLGGGYTRHDKKGDRARGLGWGSPGGNFVTYADSVDEVIHEARLGLSWSGERAHAGLSYRLSVFDNRKHAATVENPLIPPGAPGALGRLAPAPDNRSQDLTLSGGAVLPLGFPARFAGSLTLGRLQQDEQFLPHSAAAGPIDPRLSLPASNLDGRVETLTANMTLDLTPWQGFDLAGRYRLHDYDDRSRELVFPAHVLNDGALQTGALTAVRGDYQRQVASLEASQTLGEGWRAHAGWRWERWTRSGEREVRRLTSHGPELAVDVRKPWGSARASWNYEERSGSRYDPFAHAAKTGGVAGRAAAMVVGELPELRKFDEADREQHRLRLSADLPLGPNLELGLSGALIDADYPETRFGVTGETDAQLGFQTALRLGERIQFGFWGDFEWTRFDQRSRFRPRSFIGGPPVDDPRNDWHTRERARFQTIGLDIELALVPDRLDFELSYVLYRGTEETRNRAAPGSALAPPPTTSGDGGRAIDFPELEERLHTLRSRLTFHINEHTSFSLAWWLERFRSEDFRHANPGPLLPASNVNGDGSVTPSTDLFLGDDFGGYTAHVVFLTVRHTFR